MNLDIRFYLALLLRRLPNIVLIVAACTAIGAIIAYTRPPVYQAAARLLVESPQIPAELAATTVGSSADEILFAIQQRLLTRANLLDLSQMFGLHAGKQDMTPDDIVQDMYRRINIELPQMQQSGTGVVFVSFDSDNPEQSAEVTNALVSQILQQSVELRTSASGGTLDFFQQEVKRLSDEMAQQNARILEFEEAHRDSLPESLEYRRTRQSAQQERLLQVERELAGLRDRRQRLADLYDRTGQIDPTGANLTPEEQRLLELRQELASALVIYAPDNPRVRALQTQITAMEEAVKAQTGGGGTGAPSTLQLQIADIDGPIAFLAEQKVVLDRELKALEQSTEATPANAIVLGGLRSDYENLRVQYDQAVASLAEARMGDRIEITARGQRITVIEPATVPEVRSGPNRKLITATGLGAGIALSVALMVALELLNRTPRRAADMVAGLGITPFGTIPYMETDAEARRRRIRAWAITGAILFGLPLLAFLVHVLVIPLDVLAEQLGLGLATGSAPTGLME